MSVIGFRELDAAVVGTLTWVLEVDKTDVVCVLLAVLLVVSATKLDE